MKALRAFQFARSDLEKITWSLLVTKMQILFKSSTAIVGVAVIGVVAYQGTAGVGLAKAESSGDDALTVLRCAITELAAGEAATVAGVAIIGIFAEDPAAVVGGAIVDTIRSPGLA